MTEYRLYFLDKAGHFAARFEFDAEDDACALMAAAVLGEETSDAHHGFALWRGTRELFVKDDAAPPLYDSPASLRIPLTRQEAIADLEDTLLRSHWTIARSRRLLDATVDLRGHLERVALRAATIVTMPPPPQYRRRRRR